MNTRKTFGIVCIVSAILIGIPFLHEFLIIVAAWSLHQLSQGDWLRPMLSVLPVSPHYSWLFVSSLSQTGPDSTPLARFATQAIAEVTILLFGTTIAVSVWKRKVVVAVTALVVVQAILALLVMNLDMESMGAGFILGPMISGRVDLYQWLMTYGIPGFVRVMLVAIGLLPLFFTKILTAKQKSGIFATVLATGGILGAIGFPPYVGMVPKEIVVPQVRALTPEPIITQELPTPMPTPAVSHIHPPIPVSTEVKKRMIVVNPTQNQLLIDGKPATIRGVQYYFGDVVKLPKEEREKIYRRDLSIMQQTGFNTVTGWEEQGFDGTFLRVAKEHNLQVIKPLSLQPPDKKEDILAVGDFLDPTLRGTILRNLLQKIEADKNDPSVTFWMIGADEPLEKLLHLNHRNYDQVYAAADLIMEATILARKADPNHAILVNEPQAGYFHFYQEAVRKVRGQGVDVGMFFVFGANFYFAPTVKADMALLKKEVTKERLVMGVTEFAPFGVDPDKRPWYRAKMTREVMEATPLSIAYVFNPAKDVFNPAAADPTMTIVTGLALTDLERSDVNGLLAATANALGKPFFPTALEILQADRERGWFGIPVSAPIAEEDGIALYFIGTKHEGQIAYRWLLKEKTNTLVGPQPVDTVFFSTENGTIAVSGTFLESYLALGGLTRFGYPKGNAYKDGQQFRQDFTNGWSLVQ